LDHTLLPLVVILVGCLGHSATHKTTVSTNASPESRPTLYPISAEGKWGFIDTSGTIVIRPQFLSVGEFSDGLARVTIPGLTDEDQLFGRNVSGFIDRRGEFVIGPGLPAGYTFPEYINEYSYGDFHDGRARFWVGDATGHGGYIDRTGKLVIPVEYADTNDFAQGLACVSMPRKDGAVFGPRLTGFIDVNGKFVIPAKREFVALGFSEGLCVIDIQDGQGEWHPSVINLKGEVVVHPRRFTGISSFAGGVSRVVKGGKVGCINTSGEIVIPVEFDQLWEFEVSKFTAGKKGGRSFIVDRAGQCVKEITVGKDVTVGRLRSGFATAESENKLGYVNADGELVIPIQFDSGEDFRGELALVEQGSFKGYINQRGEFVWKTDRWDEPIRNAVVEPLSDFLPPNTVESLPLEYNWQGVTNAIVFASNEPFDSLQPWFTKTFGRRFKLLSENDEPGQIDISFFGEERSGSFHAVDATGDNVEGLIGFYASINMRLLRERHRPVVIGILILDR
jgi:hypothetical protein